ncbi:MAG TPA: hypothetical protein VGB91_04510 [Rhizomicrobium sp.]
MRIVAVCLAGLAAAGVPAWADDAADMRGAAQGFYGVYGTFHPSDGIPGDADRARYRPFLSPALESLLAQAAAAQARFAAANKGAPPLIEGDLFTSLFEGATATTVGACRGDGAKGQCAVDLRHDDPGAQPTAWADTVYLVHTPQGWKIDDIGYGASWDFGNKGTLSGTLVQAIRFP